MSLSRHLPRLSCNTILVVMAVLGTIFCVTTAFGLTVSVFPLILVTLISAAAFSLGFQEKKLFLVLLPVFGFLSGLLADFLINRRFVAYLLLCALALLVTSLLQALPLWIFRGANPSALFTVALLQALWALPLAVPAYFAAKLLAGYERERA